MEKFSKEYIDNSRMVENQVNKLAEAVRELDSKIKLNDELIVELYRKVDELEKDMIIVGIVDCLLLTLIGVTAFIF